MAFQQKDSQDFYAEPTAHKNGIEMKTIIHIGQHKTGTTSIQRFLRDNRKILAESGLYVPTKIAGYEKASHFILNVYSLADGRYSKKKERILKSKGKHYIERVGTELKADIAQIYKDASISNCEKVIWSNEGLYLLNSVSEYKKLVGLFTEHSTEIEAVCCFRDVESYRKSYISQLEKWNKARSDNPDSYRYVEQDSWLFDYELKKRLLAESFDKCTYFPYDPTDNVNQFMKAIGHDMGINTNDYRYNITPNNKWLFRIRKNFNSLFR